MTHQPLPSLSFSPALPGVPKPDEQHNLSSKSGIPSENFLLFTQAQKRPLSQIPELSWFSLPCHDRMCSVFIAAANATSVQNCPVQVQQVLNFKWKLVVLYEQLSQSQVIVFLRKWHHKQMKVREKWCSYLPLFVKYFILLAITAVLSLASKNENILVSSQSSTTASKGNKNDMTTFQAVNQN